MNKLEILAPAGSKESFIAAVEAGADAVYCGLGSFSARSKAENFTPAEFSNYVNYAHSKNVKVYAAFNTLIKQSEIKESVKQLSFIAAAKADAVIVQDFGILNIARKYFPELALHASTQMAIHNSYGVLQAQKAGFKRVVLARELSLSEIKNIKDKTGIEIEVFVHGALCFGVSGLCLMSSFIGGYSGNRGACAQPCRRKWSFKNKDGFYLSPKDLELASFVPELKKAGVTSLKIEGRMKNPQYVYKTVKAYKMLACADSSNFHETFEEAAKLLAQDFARPKTSFNFNKVPADVFSPDTPKQLGIDLGKILSYEYGKLIIKTGFHINAGDTLKAADVSKDAYFKINVLDVEKKDDIYTIITDSSFLKSGMSVFKTSDSCFGSALKKITDNVKIESIGFNVKETDVKMPYFKHAENKEELFIRIDNSAWLKELPSGAKAVFVLDKEKLNNFSGKAEINYYELPAYIDESDLPLFQEAVNSLLKENKAKFFINNISHLGFFRNNKDVSLFAGQFLYCLNSFSADFLFKNNIKTLSFSWEDDLKNITELSKAGLGSNFIFCLSGLPVLAVSKMKMHKDLESNELLNSAKDSFQIIHKYGKSFILPEYPVMLFNKKQQLQKLKINKFAIDLSFIHPNRSYISALMDACNGKRPLQNSFEFNFERSLK